MSTMNIENLAFNPMTKNRKNNPMFPRSIRGLIIGESGCGKTTLLLNLLLRKKWLDYNKLFIFGKSLLQQPEYILIQDAFENDLPKEAVHFLFTNQSELERGKIDIRDCYDELKEEFRRGEKIIPFMKEDGNEIPDPKDLNPKDKNLIIFDDLLKEKQDIPEKYYTRGRHNNTDCFYLSQSFFDLPRRTIRGNTNFLILFNLNERDINNIYTDLVSRDMSIDEFKNFCYSCWNKPYGFAVIDRSSHRDRGKYRRGFDDFYLPSTI